MTVIKRQFGHTFLQSTGLVAQILHFAIGGKPSSLARRLPPAGPMNFVDQM